MGLYEPKSCCICFDTKNGSLILASLSLIGAILSCLFVLFGLLSFFLHESLEQFVQSHGLDPELKNTIIVCVCIAVPAYYTFVGVCSSLLIHGIRKDRPGLMMPYLIFQRFCIVMEIITISIGIVLTLHFLDQRVFINTLILAMAAAIDIYFHLVINAYHKQVKRAVCGGKVYYQEFQNEGNDYKGKVEKEVI